MSTECQLTVFLLEIRGRNEYDWLRASGFGLRASDFGLQTSGFRLQTSGFRLQTSGFRLQTSDFRLRAGGRRAVPGGHESAPRTGPRACVVLRARGLPSRSLKPAPNLSFPRHPITHPQGTPTAVGPAHQTSAVAGRADGILSPISPFSLRDRFSARASRQPTVANAKRIHM